MSLRRFLLTVSTVLLATGFPCVVFGAPQDLPIRGLHLMAPSPDDVPLLVDFIEKDLAKEGVNTLILEINYQFEFTRYPQLRGDKALSRDQVKSIVTACKKAGIELIPQFNCVGHQSWAKNTFPLLTEFPEFDETPGKYPENEGIYCRSWCVRHEKVNEVVHPLLEELAEAFEATSFHIGMDEVFLLGEDDCPRCRGRSKAELFAQAVNGLHEFLSTRGIKVWMWGDRFLDGNVTGIGEWEAATNDTALAIDLVAKDIVICDWHYEYSPPTAGYFALKGFNVVLSPWRKVDVALNHLKQIRDLRASAPDLVAQRAQGILHTTWSDAGTFVRAYRNEEGVRESTRESAACFKQLFAAMRRQ